MAESVRVEGARELAGSLDRAAKEVTDLPRAQQESADRVAALARGKVPVLSGALRATIRAERAVAQGIVAAGGYGVAYAGVIHNGWAARNIGAHPFLTDALTEAEPIVSDVYLGDLDRVVAKIHGK